MNPYQKILELFEQNDVEYESIEHAPVFTSEQAASVRGMDVSSGAKSLLFKTKKGFVLVVLPGNRRVSSKKLKRLLIVSEVRFASPEEVKEQMGCEVGSCTRSAIFAAGECLSTKSLAGMNLYPSIPGATMYLLS